MVLQLAGDASPKTLSFGKLADLLAPFARHWCKQACPHGVQWQLLPQADAEKLDPSRRFKHGVFE
eukprot:11628308-Alexandrium_andersonii.AAC.1